MAPVPERLGEVAPRGILPRRLVRAAKNPMVSFRAVGYGRWEGGKRQTTYFEVPGYISGTAHIFYVRIHLILFTRTHFFVHDDVFCEDVKHTYPFFLGRVGTSVVR